MNNIKVKIPRLNRQQANEMGKIVAQQRREAHEEYYNSYDSSGKNMVFKSFFERDDVYYEYVYTFSIKSGDVTVHHQGLTSLELDVWLDRVLEWKPELKKECIAK